MAEEFAWFGGHGFDARRGIVKPSAFSSLYARDDL
jgi:hypothetical protein